MRGATEARLDKLLGEGFQSTLLMRGATFRDFFNSIIADFNPRSSCEERHPYTHPFALLRYFNPRSSCEERLSPFSKRDEGVAFQSTLLMRGATVVSIALKPSAEFQSTLLMRGATINTAFYSRFVNFNPRSSCEERLSIWDTWSARGHFNPRSSCEERLNKHMHHEEPIHDFNPRSSCEERLSDSQALQVAGF